MTTTTNISPELKKYIVEYVTSIFGKDKSVTPFVNIVSYSQIEQNDIDVVRDVLSQTPEELSERDFDMLVNIHGEDEYNEVENLIRATIKKTLGE